MRCIHCYAIVALVTCSAVCSDAVRRYSYALTGTLQAATRGDSDVTEVLIGYFGPAVSSHAQAGDMWRAASLAVEQANATGGYEGLPFRLVPGWSENPWGSGVSDVAKMAYVHKVWAIVGGIDGPSTHLAEQVVAKARLALVNPVATDKTVNLANVPWMFSCVPPDHVQARVLAPAIASSVQAEPFLIVSTVDHDSHLFAVELLKALKNRDLAPAYHFELDAGQPPLAGVLEQLSGLDPQAIVLISNARNSARMLRELRAIGYRGAVFGGPWMGRRAFIEQAGEAADSVIFPSLCVASAASRQFEQSFTERFAKQPDYLAAHTYDATAMTIAAIRQAGLNRARICDALKDISPWPGVSGEIRWNSAGANSRPVSLGTVANGRVQPLGRPPLAQERQSLALD